MNTKRAWQVAGVAVVFLALILSITAYTTQIPTPQEQQKEVAQAGTISISIDGLYAGKQVSISANDTVLEVLHTLNADDPAMRLSTKEYSGLGTLVEGMNGMQNGENNKYWQYKVNGVMPQIGADKLELRNGDVVEWYFAVSEM